MGRIILPASVQPLANLNIDYLDDYFKQMVIRTSNGEAFYSYGAFIGMLHKGTVYLSSYWDHSATTTKFLGQWLRAGKQIITNRLRDSEYLYLGDL